MKRKVLLLSAVLALSACSSDDGSSDYVPLSERDDTPSSNTAAANNNVSQDLKNQIAYDVCDKRYRPSDGLTWAEWMRVCIPFVQK